MRELKRSDNGEPIVFNPIIGSTTGMREELIKRLEALKGEVIDAEQAVFIAYNDVQVVKRRLQAREDEIILGKAEGVEINGENAEIRAAQVREAIAQYLLAVQDEERVLEAKKLALDGLKTELRINLALVELVKGVA
jgi:hypothetical protein